MSAFYFTRLPLTSSLVFSAGRLSAYYRFGNAMFLAFTLYLVKIKTIRQIAQLFVAFSEKLSNLIFVKELTPRPNLDFV